jgi:hypothetical protein
MSDFKGFLSDVVARVDAPGAAAPLFGEVIFLPLLQEISIQDIEGRGEVLADPEIAVGLDVKEELARSATPVERR